MMGLGGLFGGAFMGSDGEFHAAGAQQQQAGADYWRKQQEGMFNALAPTPEQRAEAERYYATRRHVEALRAADWPDWTFWYWLFGMGAALAIFRSLIHP